jgi:transcriptional regulator with XRE-family HTH domain
MSVTTEAAEKAAIARMMQGLNEARKVPRPRYGWLQLFRKSMQLSAGEVARRMKVSRHQPLQFEKAEVRDSITLRSLRSMAEAMDCDLVYGLIPKQKVTAAAVPEPRSRRDEVKIGEKSFPILNSTTTLTDLLGLMQKIR